MNAKKIMGAVLVALLAAALFVGAGAATMYEDTVFVNQKVDANTFGGTWIGDGKSVTAIPVPEDDTKVYFPAGSEGVYSYEDGTDTYYLIIKSPEVTVSATAGSDIYAYQFLNGIYYIGATDVNVIVDTASTENLDYDLYLTSPNGEEVLVENGNAIANKLKYPAEPAVGEYSIRAVFNATNFVKGTLVSDLYTKAVSFKVAEAGEGTIAASVDQAIKGATFKVTITGQPGVKYQVSFDNGDFFVAKNQIGLPGIDADQTGTFSFTMPNTGSVEFVMKSTSTAGDSEKIELSAEEAPNSNDWDKQGSVTIKFAKGTIEGKTDAKSYFVGDELKVTGTTTAGNIVLFELSGTNFYANLTGTAAVGPVKYGSDAVKTFEFKVKTVDIKDGQKKLDVGTYTLTLTTESGVKASVPVVLKQPFISIISAPEVVVKGDDAEFIINAEAAEAIQYYIFGTNFFNASATPVNTNVDDTTNQFEFKLDEDFTKGMDAGQYFMVIQHPMYDEKFNILAFNNAFYLNTTGAATGAAGEFLFNVDIRQTANAAQALCDALDTQNIDDMYVKYSFFVIDEDESFVINEIPETVAQGSTFTVSGVATSKAGEYVTVEMISTAFAAVPKENVGSAAFIVLTTQVADDGTWEVTFDTSDLNVDEYSLKVACGTETWKNVEINVVEAADEPVTPPTDEPGQDEPGQDEPVAPETPGFGALAALAGLGAVAVLLLRRE